MDVGVLVGKSVARGVNSLTAPENNFQEELLAARQSRRLIERPSVSHAHPQPQEVFWGDSSASSANRGDGTCHRLLGSFRYMG